MSTRKQIAFDLDTKALEEYYPLDSWRNAYKVIKDHMEKTVFHGIPYRFQPRRRISSGEIRQNLL